MTSIYESLYNISVFSLSTCIDVSKQNYDKFNQFIPRILVYTNKPNLSFDDLLKEDKSVEIYQKNLQILVTEIYKANDDLRTKIMGDIFNFVEKPYNLRNNSIMRRQANRTIYFGTEIISFLAPNLWELILSKIKSARSLNIFEE